MFYALTSEEIREMKTRNISNAWELLPIQGANNRAYFKTVDGVIYLKSYDTVVFSYDIETGEFSRHWDGYSATTLKHVQMFVCFINRTPYRKNSTFGKRAWDSMEVCAA